MRGAELRHVKEALRAQGLQKQALFASPPGEASRGISAHLYLGGGWFSFPADIYIHVVKVKL